MINNFKATFSTAYQYLVGTVDFAFPTGYSTLSLSNAMLAFDPRFHVVELKDAAGIPFAVIVGFPYDGDQDCFLGSGQLLLPSPVGTPSEFETSVLPRFSGSFLAITHGPLPLRVYLDPGGSLPIVFSAHKHIAAASPSLILDEAEYREQFDRELHHETIEKEGVGAWISGDLTAHTGVTRVLPNHYLDLGNWTSRRHWPQPGDFGSWLPFEVAVERASSALNRFTQAATRASPVALTLTAGFDSRLLLASTRGVTAECEFVTFNHSVAKLDVDVSRLLARQFGLQHRVIDVVESTPVQVERWSRIIGDCVVEGNRASHQTLLEIRAPRVFTGMYGEIGRCRLYRQEAGSINEKRIDVGLILSRLQLPRHPKVGESVERWLASLAGFPNSVILDLAFLELKFGNWAMAQHPAQNALKFHLMPYSQRDVLASFIGTNPVEKTTSRLFTACIGHLWPELNDIPVNRYGDYRDLLMKIGKITRPGRVRRFLRDRLS
jgi:hypothetical protein